MTQHEFNTIIQSGEGYKIEFKRNVNTDLSKELVAFANASGGRIFIGIEDDGAVSGVTIDNALKSKVTMMAHECDPSVEAELEAFNNVLIVKVPEGKNKPYRCTNGFYIRNGASSIKLTTQEIIGFIQTESKIKFDELRNVTVKFPQQLNRVAIGRYKELAGITTTLNDEELLTNLGLLYSEPSPVINNTGVLFFVENPAQFIPQSAVTCVAYKGNTKVDILDKKTFEFDIITNIDNCITFLKRHLNVSFEIGEKQRKEILEVPEVALREAVVNAVAHRDYFEKGANVMTEIFDNRVEISNPGGLPKGLKVEDFGKRTLARNPLIAALLNRAKYIEKLGTGIQRMRYEMTAAGLPEPDFQFNNFFVTTLNRLSIQAVGLVKTLVAPPAQMKRFQYLIQQLHDEMKLDMAVAATKLNSNERTIRRDLKVLKEKGWVVFSGTTRDRTYQLSEEVLKDFSNLNDV